MNPLSGPYRGSTKPSPSLEIWGEKAIVKIVGKVKIVKKGGKFGSSILKKKLYIWNRLYEFDEDLHSPDNSEIHYFVLL